MDCCCPRAASALSASTPSRLVCRCDVCGTKSYFSVCSLPSSLRYEMKPKPTVLVFSFPGDHYWLVSLPGSEHLYYSLPAPGILSLAAHASTGDPRVWFIYSKAKGKKVSVVFFSHHLLRWIFYDSFSLKLFLVWNLYLTNLSKSQFQWPSLNSNPILYIFPIILNSLMVGCCPFCFYVFIAHYSALLRKLNIYWT